MFLGVFLIGLFCKLPSSPTGGSLFLLGLSNAVGCHRSSLLNTDILVPHGHPPRHTGSCLQPRLIWLIGYCRGKKPLELP